MPQALLSLSVQHTFAPSGVAPAHLPLLFPRPLSLPVLPVARKTLAHPNSGVAGTSNGRIRKDMVRGKHSRATPIRDHGALPRNAQASPCAPLVDDANGRPPHRMLTRKHQHWGCGEATTP